MVGIQMRIVAAAIIIRIGQEVLAGNERPYDDPTLKIVPQSIPQPVDGHDAGNVNIGFPGGIGSGQHIQSCTVLRFKNRRVGHFFRKTVRTDVIVAQQNGDHSGFLNGAGPRTDTISLACETKSAMVAPLTAWLNMGSRSALFS